MRYAITSESNALESNIDSRFGRCSFFAIYDSDNGETEFLKNPAKDESDGAGAAAVQFVARQRVQSVICVEIGPKMVSILKELDIELKKEDKDQTISQIIKKL